MPGEDGKKLLFLLAFFLVTWRQFSVDPQEGWEGVYAQQMFKMFLGPATAEQWVQTHSRDSDKGDFAIYELKEWKFPPKAVECP